MELKWCPILAAGNPIRDLSYFEEAACAEGILEARIEHYQRLAGCQKERCEWYENGCPAHPIKQ